MSLSDRSIRNAKPRDSVYRIRDVSGVAKGFGLTIAPAGSKTFFLAYTSPSSGKRTQVNIGRYPAVGLKEARIRAVELREMINRGQDPKDTIAEEAKAREELKQRGTVSELFDIYISDLEMDSKRSAKEVRRIFEKHVKDIIGDKIAADVNTDDILDVLSPIVERGSLIHADNVRAYLRAAYELGLFIRASSRWRNKAPNFKLTHNPVLATKRASKHKPVGKRSLSRQEVAMVWQLPGLSLQSRLVVQLLLATGQRVEEVLQASWSEFDFDEMIWTIPAERRKTRHEETEPHIVPLCKFQAELLGKVRAETNHKRWLFPHRDGDKPRKSDGLYQSVHRFCIKNEMESFAPRDCRRTFKTLAGSIGISLEMRNRLQGHALRDVGSVHYDRWDYLPEKRKAMEEWITWLENLLET